MANRRQKRLDSQRPRRQGHPVRIQKGTARQRRGEWFDKKSPRAKRIQEINRQVRTVMERMPEDADEATALLEVVAKMVTPQMLIDFDLDPEELAPFEEWVRHQLCLALKYPDPDAYLEKRESWRSRTVDAVATVKPD